MKDYAIKVKFIFEGEVIVKAETKEEAKEIIKSDFNNTLGEIGTGIYGDEIKDWNFPIHPEKIIK